MHMCLTGLNDRYTYGRQRPAVASVVLRGYIQPAL